MKNIEIEQLELTMNKDRRCLRNIRQERRQRARWWFSKMRQVVDLAIPPRPRLHARPEQTSFELSVAGGRAKRLC
jgi:hypothetical protein